MNQKFSFLIELIYKKLKYNKSIRSDLKKEELVEFITSLIKNYD